MKKIVSVALTVAMLTAAIATAFSVSIGADPFDGYYDTLENQLLDSEAEAYYIEDAEDYKTFVRELERAGAGLKNTSGTAEAAALIYVTGNGAFAGKTVYLANDVAVDGGLDADESADFGANDRYSVAGELDAIKGFSGTFDGLGHTLSGVCLVSEVASGGSMFGYATGNVAVRNLTLENCYLQSKNPGLAALFTSVANDATVSVENVDVASDVVLYSVREKDMSGYVGGLIGNVGAATVNIRNSTFGGKIILRDGINANYVGGLVGCVTNHAKALASPILDMENCGFFGEIIWNRASAAVSKFIGALYAPQGTEPLPLPIRVSASSCVISGKITCGDALLVGAYQGASSGVSIKLSIENTVWKAEDELPDIGPRLGGTSLNAMDKQQSASGFVHNVSDQSQLSGDALDKHAVPTGEKYDLTNAWICTSDNPAPLELLGSKSGGQGTRLSEDGTHFVGYQAKQSADGYELRFLATGKDTQYDRVGMRVLLDGLSFESSTDKVYSAISGADGQTSATSLGGEYAYVAQSALSADSGKIGGVVLTWHEKDSQRYYDSVRALSIDASCVIVETLEITNDYQIYTHASASDFGGVLTNAIKAKTGASLSSALTTSGKRIFLGTADDFADVEGMRAPSYTSYQIKAVGDDVYVAIGTDAAPDGVEMTAQAAIDAFVAAIKVQNGEMLVSAALDVSGDLSLISETVPTLAGKTPSMIFSCGADNYQAKFEQIADAGVFSGYENTLRAAGYTAYTHNEINGNKFATYKKGDTHVNLSYFPYYSYFHIAYGLDNLVLPTSPVTQYASVAQPTLSMLQLTETGLSMVAQLADGSFVIIDGGTRSADNGYGKLNKQVLWDFLQSKLPAGESKPRITWILTHAHNDHVTLPNAMLRERCDEIILERVIYNCPNDKTNALFKAINQTLDYYYPDTPIWTPHTGDVLYLAGCAIEFLYTHEDRSGQPSDGNSVNNSSLVFRINMEGNSCTVFADAMEKTTTHLYNVYGTALRSDIMQVPHHGAGTASWEVYSAVDPDICLWSVGKYKFDNDVRMLGTRAGMEYNAKLRDPAYGERAHYTMSETVTVNMKTLDVSTSVHQQTCDALLAKDKATVQKK